MSKIESTCTNCKHLNQLDPEELVGEVPLMDEGGDRIPPPKVEYDIDTVFACEKCGYPVFHPDANIQS